ncbi:hypothetical protein EZH22_24310 [Xanthobacter dioxanivorans]|uniref:Uncharacterized protein n=1 Tax=Xanthobacter dioxanivorans TaxID=2528964 RepID=A0A974PML4_9HYPH|nr:hypothetical protein [Xanthobacter dioxanivorans]QRG06078.1 hypothetical protein EZH22_24310 [Xanthobacter dioxanivorans]
MAVENPVLKAKGATWWVTDETQKGGCPAHTKASLGEFFYTVISEGVQIGEIWCFNPKFHRSMTLVTIYATPEQKQTIEEKSAFRFRPPPKVHLNSTSDQSAGRRALAEPEGEG